MIYAFPATTADKEFLSFCESHKGWIFTSVAKTFAVMVPTAQISAIDTAWMPAANASFDTTIFYISNSKTIADIPEHSDKKRYVLSKLLSAYPKHQELLAITSF